MPQWLGLIKNELLNIILDKIDKHKGGKIMKKLLNSITDTRMVYLFNVPL